MARFAEETSMKIELPLVKGRECGSCHVGCRVYPIPELDKPAGVPCDYVRSERGCSIYEHRPDVCRTYQCGWKLTNTLPDSWRPDLSGYLFNYAVEKGRFWLEVYDLWCQGWSK